jgi:putative flippase GtrA
VVDFGTFNLLHAVLGFWSLGSSVISFLAAVTSNFIWNRYWTYPDSRSKPLRHQATQFTVVNLIGLGIRTPIFALTEKPMIRFTDRVLLPLLSIVPIQSLSNLSIDEAVVGRNLALAIAVIVVLFWNFGINRIWTYSDVQ